MSIGTHDHLNIGATTTTAGQGRIEIVETTTQRFRREVEAIPTVTQAGHPTHRGVGLSTKDNRRMRALDWLRIEVTGLERHAFARKLRHTV